MGNNQGKPVEFDGEGASCPPTRAAAAISPLSAWLTPPLACFPVNLNHFRLLRVVGRGAFGKVRIVERKDTNLSFALKYIRKDEGGSPPCQV